MCKLRKTRLASGISLSLLLLSGQALAAQPTPGLEEFLIIGSRENARRLAGSGAVVNSEQILNEAATDINQLLKTLPGLYIREEDGLGLRPNIGIRGATSERSSKITVMEDGVMMAPAPYSDPAAYYFPTAQRQAAVEVLKGAPLLRFGPQTTGGVINLVSTLIPETNGGNLRVMSDERGLADVHGWYGGRGDQFSYLVESVQRHGTGFKKIDRSGDEGGIAIEDYVVKLGWQSAAPRAQSLQLKMQYSEENSEETYLGLTDRDFRRDQDRRYGMSDPDEMTNRHSSVQLSYRIALSDALTATALAYDNNFKRDWYKLEGAGSYIKAANTGSSSAQNILDGTANVNGLRYKHNNRVYASHGAELNLRYALGDHTVNGGVRLHEDEVDRYQEVDVFNQISGALVFDRMILPGASDNRVGGSEAVSLWLTDNWQFSDALRITAALRYEDVDTNEVRYNNVQRTAINREVPNAAQEWLPGVSFTYDMNPNWQLLAGVHKGFSPLGAGSAEREDPESSTNYEAGLRFRQGLWFLEGIGFYSDFSQKTENCSVGSPCSNGNTVGSYNTGAAVIAGLEWQASTMFTLGDAQLPVDFSYTWTDAAISRDNPATGVLEGDLLKDVPEHLYSMRAGLELRNGLSNYVVAKYTDAQCSIISCNRIAGDLQHTDDLLVIDLISRYPFNDALNLFLKVENLLDEREIISRDPDGARPNKPRTATLGMEYRF